MILTPHLFIVLSSDFPVDISPLQKKLLYVKCAVFRNISSVADKAVFILENALEYLPQSVDCHLFWCWQNRYLKPVHKTALTFKLMCEASNPKNLSEVLTLQDILLASKAG